MDEAYELITEDKADDEVVQLPHEYLARDYQQPVWRAMFPPGEEEPATRITSVWHRRAGKDKTYINITACKAAETIGLYLYLLPTQTQARKVIWNGIGKDGFKFINHFPPDLIARKNNTEMLIEFTNGSIIQLGGSDNYDSLMGTNPIGIVFSEYSLQDPNAWEYFRPILVENGGWAVFEYTSRGKNHGYFMHKRAEKLSKRKGSGWFHSLLTVKDTKAISLKAIEEEREGGMSDELIQQEFYCSFDAYNQGAVYGKQIKKAWKDGRVGFIPVEKNLPVHSFWDIGIGDMNAIWLVQATGKEIRLVGYYENNGEAMTHYFAWMKDWKKENEIQWGEHWAPHDIEVREYTSGVKRIDAAKEAGFNFRVVPNIPIDDGIDAVRAILARCWFDEGGTEQGLNCLTEYSYEYDEKTKIYKSKPRHDWSSHGSDAFRMFAVAWKDKVFERRSQGQPQPMKQPKVFG